VDELRPPRLIAWALVMGLFLLAVVYAFPPLAG
jgi:hypothetical protein